MKKYRLHLEKDWDGNDRELHLQILTKGFLGIKYWKTLYHTKWFYYQSFRKEAEARVLEVYNKYYKKEDTELLPFLFN